jgi:hypothetical protein
MGPSSERLVYSRKLVIIKGIWLCITPKRRQGAKVSRKRALPKSMQTAQDVPAYLVSEATSGMATLEVIDDFGKESKVADPLA